MLPIKGEFSITATFGQQGKCWANNHKGVDFTAKNKNIYSTCSGTVRVVAYDAAGWGKYISIGDDDGRRHIYCHLQTCAVSEGDNIIAGQHIGVMGSTGNSTGVHLHYQMNDASNAVQNVAEYLGIPNEKGKYNSEDFNMYKDDKEISSWARNAVYEAKEKGYLVGDVNGNFRPKEPLTREEAAVLIKNLERKVK